MRPILPVIVGIAVLGLIGIVSTSYAQIETPQDKICDGEIISSGTFNSITIVGDSTCVIQNVTVLKNIIVLSTQFVEISDSTIKGDIVIDNSSDFSSIHILDSTINKNVKMTQSDHTGLWLYQSIIDKNLILKDQLPGEIHVEHSQILGDLQIINNKFDSDLELESSAVFGNSVIKNNIGHEQIQLENNFFGNNLEIYGNNVYDSIEVTINTIEGNLDIKSNNVDGLEVGENTVAKDLKITKNQKILELSVYVNVAGKKIDVSKNQMARFFINDNFSNSKIKINDNDADQLFSCHNNLPFPTLKKNTFAGLVFNECT